MNLFRIRSVPAIRQRSALRTAALRKLRRQSTLESLESRVVLSYTFSYNPVTQVATAVGTAAVDSLVIEPQSGSSGIQRQRRRVQRQLGR